MPGPSFIEQARHRQLIACAITSVAEEGYAGASLASVARRAGISKAAVLYHFRNKDALVEMAVNEILRELSEFIVPRLLAEPEARGRLRAFIQSQLLFLEQHRAHLLAVSYILVNHRNRRGEFHLRTKAENDALAAITTILEDGQARGEFRSFSVRPMAATILQAVNGALSQWVADPSLSLSDYATELVTTFDLATRKDTRTSTIRKAKTS
ncbi:MAG: TetR family transcriptional regulator [Opitutaceae bacterium]|nr:TetR family transcriptional regulator [Opitutaceae bacterium]